MTGEFHAQGTDEWLRERLGKCTASQISAVMAKGAGGKPSATRANYLAQLLTERLSGKVTDGFKSAAMEQGNEREAQARGLYQMTTGQSVREVGFTPHPKIENAGASPDGLADPDGGVEIKCPQPAGHLATLRGKAIDGGYLKQIKFNMACTGAKWWDYVSFNPDFPDAMQLFVLRIPRVETEIVEIERAVRDFLADVDAAEAEMRAKFGIE